MACLADALDLPSDAPADGPGACLTRPAGPALVGWAAVFYRAGEPGTVGIGDDGEEVRLMPGALDLAVRRAGIRAMFEHRPARVLGSVAGGTLALSLDPRGLRFRLTLGAGELGLKVLRAVKAGRLTGASFGGEYTQAREFTEGGRRVVEVQRATLAEVSLTRRPRFAGCAVVVASGNPDADALALELAAMANQDRAGGWPTTIGA